MNAASNWDGARYTPRFSIPLKKRAKSFVSLVTAVVKSNTSDFVKKVVNIEPAR